MVFGKASWAGTPSLDLATLDGTNGFRLIGIDAYDHSGGSVSSAGDVNGDGFADLIVGAPGAESAGGANDEGESYVVFGKASWAGTPSLDLATLDGTNGFRLIGIDADDVSGCSVSSAGDVNGDGFADLIVGAPYAESAGGADYEGESYVVFGKASWAGTPSLDLATLDGTNGFRLIGIDAGDGSGSSVSSAGDVNGDGFADLIVGAPGAESAGGANNEGESYVVFGGNFTGAVTHLGGAGDDTLTGTAAAETFVGGTGNDTMIGKGGADAFQGGAGDDTMRVSTLDFLLADGGSGSDTLELDGSGLHLDLTALADSRTRSHRAHRHQRHRQQHTDAERARRARPVGRIERAAGAGRCRRCREPGCRLDHGGHRRHQRQRHQHHRWRDVPDLIPPVRRLCSWTRNRTVSVCQQGSSAPTGERR